MEILGLSADGRDPTIARIAEAHEAKEVRESLELALGLPGNSLAIEKTCLEKASAKVVACTDSRPQMIASARKQMARSFAALADSVKTMSAEAGKAGRETEEKKERASSSSAIPEPPPVEDDNTTPPDLTAEELAAPPKPKPPPLDADALENGAFGNDEAGAGNVIDPELGEVLKGAGNNVGDIETAAQVEVQVAAERDTDSADSALATQARLEESKKQYERAGAAEKRAKEEQEKAQRKSYA